MATSFLNEDFLLSTESSKRLYHEFASAMPIIDYHNHLSPEMMASDHRFANITQAWLQGDHYKWRAMRSNGIAERYCTGDADDREKFMHWAETVPYTIRNPLFHWTHLELRRYFGVNELLNASSAPSIYTQCSDLLQTPAYTVRGLLEKMQVRVICTTDDPVDELIFHQQIKAEGWKVKVLPAFRPDKAMQIADPEAFNNYVERLEDVADEDIRTYQDFLEALKSRHDHFAKNGACISDHGLERIDYTPFTDSEIRSIFSAVRQGKKPDAVSVRQFQTAMLLQFAEWDWEKGWVQQFHLGAMRNNNTRMMQSLGPDTGWDSIGDYPQAAGLSALLDHLDKSEKLPKTILYNLNPADNELMASMIGNFNDGSVPGKIQWGSAWWFLDQKEGMVKQLNTLSQLGLLSRFIGMLTDSRSFLSFPRHEYFRRILCDLLGREMESGELPNDIPWMGKVVKDICYHNACSYFGFTEWTE